MAVKYLVVWKKSRIFAEERKVYADCEKYKKG